MKINSKITVTMGCLAVHMFFAQQHQFLSVPEFNEADLRKSN